ncbi:hypothetical protein Fmac_005171 [Flemingia macrophylla]|uniref:Uncharacterized protein n=1 Tax=Flemingia macrophylla TaxID=520843 RepID=A0ABD1N6Z3_9FABA
MILNSDPVLYWGSHLSEECLRLASENDDEDDEACVLPLRESKSIAAVGAMDKGK